MRSMLFGLGGVRSQLLNSQISSVTFLSIENHSILVTFFFSFIEKIYPSLFLFL